MKPSRLFGTGLLVLAILGAGANATAQSNGPPQSSRVELWGAASGVIPRAVGALTTSYSPPLLFDGDFTSHGEQTLKVDTVFAVGVTGGMNVFPTPRLGFQILFDRASCDVSATNTAYTVALQYVSRQPPNNEAQVVTVDQSIVWPDTSGFLTHTAVALNAVVRIGRPDHLSVTISGGPTYYRVSGLMQPVGFTTFHLGGHSVLFEDDYRLALSLKPDHAFGLDIGGEFNVAIGRHGVIFAGYRYFGGSTTVAVSPTIILNANELTLQQPIADVASRLASPGIRVSASASRVAIGIKVPL